MIHAGAHRHALHALIARHKLYMIRAYPGRDQMAGTSGQSADFIAILGQIVTWFYANYTVGMVCVPQPDAFRSRLKYTKS